MMDVYNVHCPCYYQRSSYRLCVALVLHSVSLKCNKHRLSHDLVIAFYFLTAMLLQSRAVFFLLVFKLLFSLSAQFML